MNTERIILVTGANRGIGRAIVQAILEKTDDSFVYVGARDPTEVKQPSLNLRSSTLLGRTESAS